MKFSKFALFLISTLLLSCSKEKEKLFTLQSSSKTGIDFKNVVENTEDFNIFNYRNFYNGGGVAAGDINNDGLVDLYFTANRDSNKLYLNKGNFEFEDITVTSETALAAQWSTGVVMVDINADGWLDIYVCNAGYQKGIGQENALFINNKDNTFTEKAAQFGLNDGGYTTHSAFFDYDLDGDLDVYILNNSFIPVNTLNNANNRSLRAEEWPVADFLKGGGDKFLRNDGNWNEEGLFIPKYVDVSEEVGVYGSLIGFGLGVTVGDVNNDNYPDIYVSNDFYEKDYLYLNQTDGTFREDIENRINHTSFASMGADMADINNDGHSEIFVTDMLPRTEERLKTTTAFDSHYTYDLRLEKGFYHQYMQNTLQLNNGKGYYKEIASLTGVAASDWSWGALMFDADNDRNTDILICNGIQHDVINQDFIDFFANELSQKKNSKSVKKSFASILSEIPSKPQVNLFFKNKGELRFEESSEEWGITKTTFSNGATYADLDNDGDLDFVVNNVGEEAHIFKNNSKGKHFLKFKLEYKEANPFAIGTKVKIYKDSEVLMKELIPSRGFQSSTDYELHLGLGDWASLDSAVIFWPNSKISKLLNPPTDTLLKLTYKDLEIENSLPIDQSKKLFNQLDISLPIHQENAYEDYYNEKNIPFKLSQEGPSVAVGDLNGDGLSDIVFGGGFNQPISILFQGTSQPITQDIFQRHQIYEDTATLLFDADNDGDLDLYIGSGGNQAAENSPSLFDRLYLNNGLGKFTNDIKSLPKLGMNTSVILPLDMDNDGDLDLFVGSRSYPQVYGKTPPSYVLENTGMGRFKLLQQLELGMITDAIPISDKEIIVIGDWMSPTSLKVKKGKLETLNNGLEDFNGFWKGAAKVDYNNDGLEDVLLGNIGENFALEVSKGKPLKLYLADFDQNGTLDKVMSKTYSEEDVPVFLKRELTDQFPFLKAQSLKHEDYASKTLSDLFDHQILRSAQKLTVNYLHSAVAINKGDGQYEIQVLPVEFQFSSIHSFLSVESKSQPLLLAAGNSKNMIPQFNTLDASSGWVYDMSKKLVLKEPGFVVNGEVKQILPIRWNDKPCILVTRNDQKPLLFGLNEQ